jgi:ubiquinone/menaquinone biosynthesis C-methylase UbiE
LSARIRPVIGTLGGVERDAEARKRRPWKGATVTSDEFSFAKFSMNAFYASLNARLVDMVDLGSNQRIVDMACGTGAVTRLILERLRGARDSVIIALDQSATGLKQAMEDLKDVRDSAVQFVQSRVEHMSEAVKESVDTIFYCNAIHYVTDKDALVAEVSKTLKPGGRFAFNTSFFEGGQTPESRQFYRKWMLKSSRILRQDYGLKPARAEKVESRKHLTVDEYRALVERHGFSVVRHEIDAVNVPIEGWLDISTFEDFITGIMPGVPLDKASAALQKGLVQTFEEMEIQYVSRNWLDVLAVRV